MEAQTQPETSNHGLFLRRFGAFMVDWLVLATIGYASERVAWLAFLVGRMGLGQQGWPENVSEWSFIAVVVVYFGVIQTYSGKTFGKALFKLRLAVVDGHTWPQSLLRFLMYPGPLFLLMFRPHGEYVAALITICALASLDLLVTFMSGATGRSLHDWLGGTRVVATTARERAGLSRMIIVIGGLFIVMAVFVGGSLTGAIVSRGLPSWIRVGPMGFNSPPRSQTYVVAAGGRADVFLDSDPLTGKLARLTVCPAQGGRYGTAPPFVFTYELKGSFGVPDVTLSIGSSQNGLHRYEDVGLTGQFLVRKIPHGGGQLRIDGRWVSGVRMKRNGTFLYHGKAWPFDEHAGKFQAYACAKQ